MARSYHLVCSLGLMLGVMSAFAATGQKPAPGIKKSIFGKTTEGQVGDLYTLSNRNGMQVGITNYGGRVVSIVVPDRHGKMADVVLGFDNLDGYLGANPFFGALVGRYANRIAKGRFKLDGVEYKLAVNDGPNSLHGGVKGFDKMFWTAKEFSKNGFEWSYEGPEPRQLALALLADHLGDDAAALASVEPFMRSVVANFGNEWEMTSADIDQALAALSGKTAA